MPTFCRHNRFIDRCPICSKTLLGNEPAAVPTRRSRAGSPTAQQGGASRARRPRADGLRVRREGRAAEDGYRSDLVPGLRSSADAERLAREIAFSSARLGALAADSQGTYRSAHEAAAAGRLEQATWACFLLAYLCPTEDDDPFASVEAVLAAEPLPVMATADQLGRLIDELPLGPRSSHRPGSGAATIRAYADWVRRAGGEGGQAAAFEGDSGWSPQRRFARLFERLALPGLSRAARYELLVSLGRLGIYELRADSLHLSARSGNGEDATTLGAKRVFGIGDPLLLDRRAAALAAAASVPLEGLDMALANWAAAERATYGFSPAEQPDAAGVAAALGL